MNWLSFLIGVLTGWLIELFIDFFFWRRRRTAPVSESETRAELAAMEAKASQLEAQLVAVQDDQRKLTACERQLRDCRDALSRVQMQLSAGEPEVQQVETPIVDAQVYMAERTGSPAGLVGFEAHDLQKIEGIGPKIATILNAHGIHTFADLAEATVETLQKYLEEAGPRYRLAHPETWPEQARLAAGGWWEALEELQDQLKGGRRQPQ
jgi:predicted flap endonuclease-1-like 5' DNA nuclease